MGLQIISQTESVDFTYTGDDYRLQGSLNHTAGVIKRLDVTIFSTQENGLHLGNISLSETGSCSINIMNNALVLSITQAYITLQGELQNSISQK